MSLLKQNLIQILLVAAASLIGWGAVSSRVEINTGEIAIIKADRKLAKEQYEVLMREIIGEQKAQGAKIDILLERTK